MAQPKKSMGKGRPNRAHIYLPDSLWQATAEDRDTGRFNDKVNRLLEAVYAADGGTTDTLDLQIQEHNAEAERHKAIASSLTHQREAVLRTIQEDVQLRKAEATFKEHLSLAVQKGLDIRNWAHPGRSDVQGIGWSRARQIVKEVAGIDIK